MLIPLRFVIFLCRAHIFILTMKNGAKEKRRDLHLNTGILKIETWTDGWSYSPPIYFHSSSGIFQEKIVLFWVFNTPAWREHGSLTVVDILVSQLPLCPHCQSQQIDLSGLLICFCCFKLVLFKASAKEKKYGLNFIVETSGGISTRPLVMYGTHTSKSRNADCKLVCNFMYS